MTTIFNQDKTAAQYAAPELFLGQVPGLVDTVHKHYPQLWERYKQMKSLDWDENEFDYSKCLAEFQTCDPNVSDMMVKTLLWQWEADSVASRAPLVLIAPFCSSTELYAAEQRITDNEMVHAATYSEIVRMSFSKPQDVLERMLEHKEAMQRLGKVAEFMDEFYILSHQYALRTHTHSTQELWDMVAMFYFVMFCLERIQFMASFAITFTICETGLFQPIGKAVQKIAQDELEVHCEYRKDVLRLIRQHPMGALALERCLPRMRDIFREVVESEMAWSEWLFQDKFLVGTNVDIIQRWVLFNAAFVNAEMMLGMEDVYDFPYKNPMPHLIDWFNIGAFQSSPQEQINNQYKIVVVKDDEPEDLGDISI